MEEQCPQNFGSKYEERKPLGRPGDRCEDNITT
jgi:hypothetical protein